MKTPKLTAAIKGAMGRQGISSTSLAKITGIPYQTLRYRFKNPASWRFCEWGAVLRHIDLNDSEEKDIKKELIKL